MMTDVLVIGAGLSGLHTAYELQNRDVSCVLVEGRDRVGGRVLSVNLGGHEYDPSQPGFDLGPSWFWPGQHRMLALVEELGLAQDVFAESDGGHAVFEDQNGDLQRSIGGGAMAGSYRMRGGIRQIIAALQQRISAESVIVGATASAISLEEDQIITTLEAASGVRKITSRYTVMALPPRIAMATVQFSPALTAARTAKLNNVATWMAGQAKIVALYDTPFWRQDGLSGDAMSRRGPMQEIHDASPAKGGPYALFGFVGVPVAHRREQAEALKVAATAQFTRLFGDKASTPLAVHIKDWAFEPLTSTERDHEAMQQHLSNDPGELSESSWQHRLIWSGTETAPTQGYNNGYLEGALESSEQTLNYLQAKLMN